MKKCIVYMTYELSGVRATGARIMRGRQMLQAFEAIGYDVFLINGSSSKRKRLIKALKQSIRDGEKYEFMYAESNFFPMLLTDEHHFPLHPFMDFGFFKYIKKKGIRIGLFFRDAEWKFREALNDWAIWKRMVASVFYAYDLWQYERWLDVFYVPSRKMMDYLKSAKLRSISKPLPPGAEELTVDAKDHTGRDFVQNPLNILYVGSICSHFRYRFEKLLEAVRQTENCVLTICCPEMNWQREGSGLAKYMNDHIQVIHRVSEELYPYYERADLGSLIFENSDYMNMAVPYKSFEYLGHELPMIATEGMVIGDFIAQNDIGWVIPYRVEAIQSLLRDIIQHPEKLNAKQRNCKCVKKAHLWTCRAQTVENDLCQPAKPQ